MNPLPARRPVTRGAQLLAVSIALVATWVLILSPAAPAATRHVSEDQLSAARHAVEQSGVRGIAWYVDGAADRVVVTADSTVSSAEVATIMESAGADAVAIRINYVPGKFRPLLSRGDAIYGGQYRCSLGFNVVSGSTYYFLTAGHCGKVANTWYTNPGHTTLIGPTVNYSFPGNDYALVRYANASLSHPGGFTIADAFVGESVTAHRIHHRYARRHRHRAERHGPLRRSSPWCGQWLDSNQRVCRARRLRRPAL